jgi:hypothetical protein
MFVFVALVDACHTKYYLLSTLRFCPERDIYHYTVPHCVPIINLELWSPNTVLRVIKHIISLSSVLVTVTYVKSLVYPAVRRQERVKSGSSLH